MVKGLWLRRLHLFRQAPETKALYVTPDRAHHMLLSGRLFSLPQLVSRRNLQSCVAEGRALLPKVAAAEEGKLKVIDVDTGHWIMIEKPGIELSSGSIYCRRLIAAIRRTKGKHFQPSVVKTKAEIRPFLQYHPPKVTRTQKDAPPGKVQGLHGPQQRQNQRE